MQAAAALFEVPAQNIVFATADGHIGYQAPGKIPVRQAVPDAEVPSDGTWPRDGSDERYDWQGYVPSEEMPRVVDPAEGFIVAANQAVLPDGVAPFLTTDWDYGYRSQRIRQLLEAEIAAGRTVDVDTMNEVQVDDRSPYAEVLVQPLLEQEIDDDFAAEGQQLLADWDYRTDTDSAAAAYFAAVWRNLLQLTFWDDLPESARPSGGSRWLAVVQNLLENPTDPFWDDRQTVSVVETRDEVLTQALVSARLDLTVEQSKQPSDWAWGKIHVLALEHPVLGGESIPGPVRDFVNPAPVGMPGGSSIVNATAWDAASGSFDVTAGPSMRMVVDLGDLDRSTWVTVTGTSGHPASKHYADQLDLGPWRDLHVAVLHRGRRRGEQGRAHPRPVAASGLGASPGRRSPRGGRHGPLRQPAPPEGCRDGVDRAVVRLDGQRSVARVVDLLREDDRHDLRPGAHVLERAVVPPAALAEPDAARVDGERGATTTSASAIASGPRVGVPGSGGRPGARTWRSAGRRRRPSPAGARAEHGQQQADAARGETLEHRRRARLARTRGVGRDARGGRDLGMVSTTSAMAASASCGAARTAPGGGCGWPCGGSPSRPRLRCFRAGGMAGPGHSCPYCHPARASAPTPRG